jgi:beta-glucosidase
VVGPRSEEVLQDWYSGTPPYSASILEGIKNKLGAGVSVSHTTNSSLAIAMAKSAEVVVVCLGNNPTGNLGWKKVDGPSEGREAVDRENISLDTAQESLIKNLYKINPHIVLVMVSNFPYAINWEQANIPAILHVTHCSQEQGNALADALFGDINPGGKLVQTWPDSLAQLPPMMDYNIRDGRTYMYFKGKPLYPFGFGLSYTTFQYSNLKTSAGKLDKNGELTVSVDIKNTGSRTGDEVVQLYVKHLKSKVSRPLEELKGFKRVTLNPGETQTVDIKLPASLLAYWDVAKKSFVVEKEPVEVMVGSSSADLRGQKEIEVR